MDDDKIGFIATLGGFVLAALGISLKSLFYDPWKKKKEEREEFLKKMEAAAPSLRPMTENPFHFTYPAIGMYGREGELKRLEDFRDDSRKVLYWCISGVAGCGKSKLVYRFLRYQKNDPRWSCHYLNLANTYGDFDRIREILNTDPPLHVLLAFDSAGAKAADLGQWLQGLSDNGRKHKLRVLLIERKGNAEENGWYRDFLGIQQEAEGTLYQKEFLEVPDQLPPACRMELLKAVDASYHSPEESRYKPEMGRFLGEHSEALGGSVLYTLAAAHAMMEQVDEKDIAQWNKEDTLAYALEKHFRPRWSRFFKTGEEQRNFERAYAFATICGGISLNELPTPTFPTPPFTCMKENGEDTTQKLLQSLSEYQETEKLVPLQPDLIGEYFVLQVLKGETEESLAEWHRALKEQGWEAEKEFLDRYLSDFGTDEATVNTLFDLLYPVLGREEGEAEEMAEVLFHYTLSSPLFLVKAAITQLKDFQNRFSPNEWIALKLTNGLFNLATAQAKQYKEAECGDTIEQLDALWGNFPENEGIALYFASGLFNLFHGQTNPVEGGETIKRLETLWHDNFPQNRKIALVFAQALVNFSNSQTDSMECGKIIGRLEILWRDYFPEDKTIAIEFANGLVNLSCTQVEPEERGESIGRLEILWRDHFPENGDIALVFAKGLFNLSCVQTDPKEQGETIERLEILWRDYFPKSGGIALEFANGLVNLSATQVSPNERGKTVKRLETLWSNHFSENLEIALRFAKGLNNCAVVETDPTNCHWIVQEARKLHKAFEDVDSEQVTEIRFICEEIERHLR